MQATRCRPRQSFRPTACGPGLLMRLSNAAFKVSFELPDNPTVFQVLAYDSAKIENDGKPLFVTLWECARAIVSEWDCESIPALDTPLDTLTGVMAARVVEYTGTQAVLWRNALDEVHPN